MIVPQKDSIKDSTYQRVSDGSRWHLLISNGKGEKGKKKDRLLFLKKLRVPSSWLL